VSTSRTEADLASVSCLDDRVRGRLYAFVSGRSEPVGRDEAAAAVGIGRALAVYHLDKLVESGLLTASYRRPPGRGGPGAGRPAKVYARSDGEFMVTVPAREYQLAARLLVQAVAADRSGQVRAALHDAARQLGADLGERHRADGAQGGAGGAQGGADGAQGGGPRLALESALSELGFEPWHDDHGTVRTRNCPFRRLAELQPEVVCHMNLALIQGLVAGLGADSLNPVLDPEPDHCCVVIPAAAPDRNGTR
jgi:predicted ArsR family transcriptional regulator